MRLLFHWIISRMSSAGILLFLCALLGRLCSSKFFIYDWPEYMNDVYPPPNATLHPESTYSHEFHPNNGAGLLLDGETGLFQTWQFALYKNMMQRLRCSRDRTFDPEEATVFIIPFDCGVHSYIDHENGRKRLGSPHGWVAKMLLENSPYMRRRQGHDHFVIFSITLYQMIGIGVKMFYQEICYNCTTLVIESSPAFVTSISGWPYKNYWHAVPYPSSFHWWEGIQRLPWSLSGDRESPSMKSLYQGRDIFTLFIGSIRTATVAANRFRKDLHDQCLVHANRTGAAAHNLTNTQGFSWCEWHTVSHTCHALINQTHLLPLYRRAVFCPAPVGDSLTRKSLFDALVAGCIPVIFDRRSLSQYTWHVPVDVLDDLAVVVSKTTAAALSASSETLSMYLRRTLSPAEIRRRQTIIAQHASTLQYALVPSEVHANVRQYERQLQSTAVASAGALPPVPTRPTSTGMSSAVAWQPWEPPHRDAVSVVIDRLLGRPRFSSSSSRAVVSAVESLSPTVDGPMNTTYLRDFCQHNNNVVADGVVFSRGLAWHRLRQLCQSVGLQIQHDGRIVDLLDPVYQQQQREKRRGKSRPRLKSSKQRV